MTHRNLSCTLWLAAAALLALGGARPAAAHTEGKMQLAAAPAGPFQITAWTAPDPAVAGDVHVSATVFSAEDASPILDAEVVVFLTPVASPDGALSQVALRTSGENNLLYESVFAGVEAGDYQVRIEMTGADGQTGEASFDLEVASAGGTNWLLVAAIVLALAAAAMAILARRRPRPVD